jgi:hypothetical protein
MAPTGPTVAPPMVASKILLCFKKFYYISYSILHSKFRTHSSKFAFLNPYKISGKACQETPIDVVSYLVAAMRLHHGTSFLVAPYLQRYHRFLAILIIICFFFIYTNFFKYY